MSGLILLLILVTIVILVLLVSINARTGEQQRHLQSLSDHIKYLTHELAELTKQVKGLKQETPVTPAPAKESEQPASPPIIKKEPLIPEQVYQPQEKITIPVSPKPATPNSLAEEEDERLILQKHSRRKEEPWFARNTDMEKFIGENLANKIGIAVLVLGISFFVKYAIDKNWINETGRVMVGIACGAILIGIAHYIRNSYRSFSSVLVGGGLTVFYFTIAFAFHQYQLIGQQAAFISMVVITGFAVALSIFYGRQELAILATIGGFITPFLASTGNENYVALFTYLCILCSGLMILSWFKRWPVINIIAVFFTTIIYGGWLLKRLFFSNDAVLPHKEALLFATIFYLLFIAMNIINNLRLKRNFGAFDFIIVLSINFLYYAAGMLVLNYWNDGDYQGLFTAVLGVFNMALAVIFYSRKKVDPNFTSLLIALTVTFISLAAPVQFRGNHIVLFWAAEAVVLFWLYQRSRIKQLSVASWLLSVLMLVSLIVSWTGIYFNVDTVIPVIANKGFITTFLSSIALFVYYLLLKKEDPAQVYNRTLSNKQAADYFLVIAVIVAYLAGVLEIYYQFSTRFEQEALHVIYWQAYTFATAILLLRIFRQSDYFPLLKFLLTALCFGLYLFSLRINYQVSFNLLSTDKSGLFAVHWAAAALLCWLLYDMVIFFFRSHTHNWLAYRTAFTCVATTGIVLLLSVEMYHVILWTNYQDQGDWAWWQNLYYKAGLSICWGLCSFVMMWLGMKYGFRTLRVISLSLFSITLVKLFLYDIRNVPPGGKIAAFILLGVLLLTVSFMYQRLKKIIIDKEEKDEIAERLNSKL